MCGIILFSDNSYLRKSRRDRGRSYSSISPDRRGRQRRSPPSTRESGGRNYRRRSVSRERRSRRSSSGERRPRRRSSSRHQRKYSPSMSSTSSSQSSRSNSKTRHQETPPKSTSAKSDRPVVSNSLADEIAKQVQVILQRSKEVTYKLNQKQEADNYSSRVLVILCLEHRIYESYLPSLSTKMQRWLVLRAHINVHGVNFVIRNGCN